MLQKFIKWTLLLLLTIFTHGLLIAQDSTTYHITIDQIKYLSGQQERYKLTQVTKDILVGAYVECDSFLNVSLKTIDKYKELYSLQNSLIAIKDNDNYNLNKSIGQLQKELDRSRKTLIFVASTTSVLAGVAIIVAMLK